MSISGALSVEENLIYIEVDNKEPRLMEDGFGRNYR